MDDVLEEEGLEDLQQFLEHHGFHGVKSEDVLASYNETKTTASAVVAVEEKPVETKAPVREVSESTLNVYQACGCFGDNWTCDSPEDISAVQALRSRAAAQLDRLYQGASDNKFRLVDRFEEGLRILGVAIRQLMEAESQRQEVEAKAEQLRKEAEAQAEADRLEAEAIQQRALEAEMAAEAERQRVEQEAAEAQAEADRQAALQATQLRARAALAAAAKAKADAARAEAEALRLEAEALALVAEAEATSVVVEVSAVEVEAETEVEAEAEITEEPVAEVEVEAEVINVTEALVAGAEPDQAAARRAEFIRRKTEGIETYVRQGFVAEVAERLINAGVTRVEDLAVMSASDIAETTGFTIGEATELQAFADLVLEELASTAK
jgi:hypothetical protein